MSGSSITRVLYEGIENDICIHICEVVCTCVCVYVYTYIYIYIYVDNSKIVMKKNLTQCFFFCLSYITLCSKKEFTVCVREAGIAILVVVLKRI